MYVQQERDAVRLERRRKILMNEFEGCGQIRCPVGGGYEDLWSIRSDWFPELVKIFKLIIIILTITPVFSIIILMGKKVSQLYSWKQTYITSTKWMANIP